MMYSTTSCGWGTDCLPEFGPEPVNWIIGPVEEGSTV